MPAGLGTRPEQSYVPETHSDLSARAALLHHVTSTGLTFPWLQLNATIDTAMSSHFSANQVW